VKKNNQNSLLKFPRLQVLDEVRRTALHRFRVGVGVGGVVAVGIPHLFVCTKKFKLQVLSCRLLVNIFQVETSSYQKTHKL
jgi:hypothetical protein